MDGADFVNAAELINRQDAPTGACAEGGSKAALDDQSRKGFSRGEIHGDARTYRAAMRDDLLVRHVELSCQIVISCIHISIGSALGWMAGAQAVAVVIKGKNRKPTPVVFVKQKQIVAKVFAIAVAVEHGEFCIRIR